MTDRHHAAAAPATRRIAAGFLAGARDCLPIALGVVAYGFVFGVVARQKGLAPIDVLALSAAVYSGTAQLVALDLWRSPLPLWPVFLSAVIVSLRYLLICASCRPLLAKWGWGCALAAVVLVSDANWAVTMSRAAGGRAGAGHLLGGGLVVYLAWCGSTAAGCVTGGLVPDPAAWGLDFAFTAAVLALLAGMWRGPADLFTWALAGAAAVAASFVLPGKWYILVGGLAGSLGGVLRRDA
jgi:predicted branched-subunit amino acid permease